MILLKTQNLMVTLNPSKTTNALLPLPVVSPSFYPPPSVPIPKLNLPVARPLPEAVREKEVAILVYTTCTDRPNGGPELCSCCANADNCENVFRAGGFFTSSALEEK